MYNSISVRLTIGSVNASGEILSINTALDQLFIVLDFKITMSWTRGNLN